MKIFSTTLLLCLLVSVSDYCWSKPQVLTSIKPLSLLAQDLLGDLAVVETLLSPTADPHHYTLRVSDRRRIEQADLMVWMGPDLERFLVKPLSSVEQGRKLVITNLERVENNGEELDHPDSSDPHAWLNPRIGILISQAIAQNLSNRYPDLKPEIEKRLLNRTAALNRLEQQLRQQLEKYNGRAFLADHPAYQALVGTYGLRQVESVQKHDSIGLSAGHLAHLTELVKAEQPSCLLVRLGYDSPSLQTWAKRWQLPLVPIDPLGVDAAITEYQDLMAAVAHAIETCFESS